MKNRELNEEQIEQLVQEAMPKVAKRHDEEIINGLSNMSHQQLDEILDSIKKGKTETEGTSDSSVKEDTPKHHARIMTFVRLAVACAVILLIIVGIDHLNLGGTTSNGYASLFNTYYKEYKVSDETFSAGEDKLNTNGKANTAYMIQEASQFINNKHSRQSLHKGIARLEHLLTLQYRPELEHEIHWYLGLAYLKDNRINKAREEFQKVIYLKSPHSADAKKLLEQMK